MGNFDIVGFGGSVLNYLGQIHQQNRAFKMNKELAGYQNQLNIDQWNRENAYNSPLAQMNRYKQAGLNPNLIYGQQNLSANSPELVGGTSAQQTNANILDANSIAQLSLLKAQKENIDADTKSKLSNVDLNYADIDLKMKQGELTDAEIEKIAVDNQLTQQETANLRSMNEQIVANTEYIRQQTAESVQRIENLKSEKALTDEQIAIAIIDKLNKQKWYDAAIDKMQAEAHCSRAMAKKALEEVVLVQAQVDLTKSEKALTDAKKTYQDNENRWYDAEHNNTVIMQRAELRAIASRVCKDNVDNLNKLYGDVAGIVAAGTGVQTTTK